MHTNRAVGTEYLRGSIAEKARHGSVGAEEINANINARYVVSAKGPWRNIL